MECEVQAEEQELGHYQFRRLLGEGGFGQVYEAWDPKLQRSIAIKRLKPKLLSARPETLLDEARMAASLRHPAFVKIFSIDGDADQQSIVMEYVDGLTLRAKGQGAPLSEEVALDIVLQVADAMQEAHASQLIHGDLKPSNLMLEASGTVRIMDFGLARRIDPQSTESVVMDDAQGTIAYLAPELLTGTRPNEQSDVYSLGVVLYEMLTGGRPFPHLSGLALAAAYMQSSSSVWPFPVQTKPALVALVRSMTERTLSMRLSSMRDVRLAIAAIRSNRAPAMPTGWALIRWMRSRSKWQLGFATGLGVLTVVAALGLMLAREGKFANTFLFSESAAMEAGNAALAAPDREQSIDAAIHSFSSILEQNPEHAAGAAGLSRAYALRYMGNSSDASWLQRADASAQLALRINDQLALAHAAQGVVLSLQGNDDAALPFAVKALQLDPRDSTALLLKSSILVRRRQYAEAEQIILTGSRMHPEDSNFADALGTLKYAAGEYPAAVEAFRHSIKLRRDGVTAYANLSATLWHLNRLDEALAVLQQGLQVSPHWRLYQNLGSVLFDRGNYVESAKAFERGLTGGGEFRYVNWANLADTLRWIPGRKADSEDAYRQAVARLKPALQKVPDSALINSRLGLYLARLGDKQGALAATKIALASAQPSGDVHFRAAIVFELHGERTVALAELGKALERKYPRNLISSEPDLIALRRDPRFIQPLPESP